MRAVQILAGLWFWLILAPMEVRAQELKLETSYRLVTDTPLTTEKIWTLDPGQINPHLQRWILSRRSEILGLKAFKREDGKFGVQANGVFSTLQGYIREDGPWYQSLEQFRCEKEPVPGFYTREGSKRAVSEASENWIDLLKKEKLNLILLLERVKGDSEPQALDRGEETFRHWIENLEKNWRIKTPIRARKAEWSFYLLEAKSAGICPLRTSKSSTAQNIEPPSTRSMMELPKGDIPTVNQILARIPARLWGGMYTVRANILVGNRKLNGRFLIDSGARMSVVSPFWMENQGVPPTWVELPKDIPQHVVWSHRGPEYGTLAKRARMDGIEISGLSMPLKEFLVQETEFFSPPNFVGSCCDGVLGADFLKLYPMEFDQSGAWAEVRVWPKENFHWSVDTPWVELHESDAGDLISSCQVTPETGKAGKTLILPGVRWETGSDTPLRIHIPWVQQGRKFHSWNLECEGLKIASAVTPTFSSTSGREALMGPSLSRVPAADAGILLMDSGKFTFDIPHGRLWFPKGELNKKGPVSGKSGLVLRFTLVEGERILLVDKIRPGSPAEALKKEGLRVGMRVTQLDSKYPEDIDFWEVEKRLSGEYGEWVSLQWRSRSGLKMAPLRVRPEIPAQAPKS